MTHAQTERRVPSRAQLLAAQLVDRLDQRLGAARDPEVVRMVEQGREQGVVLPEITSAEADERSRREGTGVSSPTSAGEISAARISRARQTAEARKRNSQALVEQWDRENAATAEPKGTSDLDTGIRTAERRLDPRTGRVTRTQREQRPLDLS